ncbi:phospholipase D-like protein [Kribbella voronezhensis]|uniref:Phospholipase D-like protein n=1 Tax=Kribbella voronezhensis TaxID=2512212 RepID=A0A4R7SXD1_9ACTN|nr:PLDc N-terminal domain-containing protein [Kribbella voronezhensis]TDU83326.1 phospholipase D-like protein [Kribbella voronezhensis]
MSFWDVVWFIVISFAFIAYLMMLVSILADIFRDPETSGAAKALWLLCLFFLPFLTALVYVILRGDAMAKRSMASARAARKQEEDYIRGVAGSATPADQISRAKAMLDDGTISPSEFDLLKAKALAT